MIGDLLNAFARFKTKDGTEYQGKVEHDGWKYVTITMRHSDTFKMYKVLRQDIEMRFEGSSFPRINETDPTFCVMPYPKGDD